MTHTNADNQRFVDALRDLDVHQHLCMIYESREERCAAIVPFLQVGLERGDRCVYIADDNSCEDVLEAMRDGGIDVDAAQAHGALSVVTKQDAYLKQGFFDPDWMIDFLGQATESALEDGFRALRVTGEMTWVFGGDPGVERLVEYEAKLNRFFPRHECLAICQYNRKRFEAAMLIDVIRTHPFVISGATVCDNSDYVPPDEFLKPEQDHVEAEVERLLAGLVNEKRAQEVTREAAAQWRLMFDAIGDPVSLLDTEQRIVRANRAMSDFVGVPIDQTIGRRCWELVHCSDRPIDGCPVRRAMTTRERERVHIEAADKVLEVTAEPIIDKGGALTGFAHTISDVTARVRARRALSESKEQLAADLEAMTKLQEIGALFLHEGGHSVVLGKVVEAALAITCADMASIQILDNRSGDLKVVAQHGFEQRLLDQWDSASEGQGVRGTALERGERVIVEDVTRSSILAGTPAPEALLNAGVPCAQSTPLVSRVGEPVGVLSTYCRQSCRLDDRVLRLLDLLARQATDIIDRADAQDALRASEEKLAAAFRASPDVVILFTLNDGRVVEVNDAVLEVLGHRRDEVMGKTTLELGVWADVEAREAFAAILRREGRVRDQEVKMRTKSGEIRDGLASAEIVALRDDTYIVSVLRDITERKQIEELKTDLVAAVSHELRSPLAVIMGYAAFLEQSADDPARRQEAAVAAHKIHERSAEMKSLIEGLLDLVRLQSGEFELSPETVDIRKLVGDVVARVPRTRRHRICLRLPTHSSQVVCDPRRLSVAITDLVTNAVKFSPEGGSVWVTATSKRGRLHISVKDEGVGIPREDQGRIFDRFTQADMSATRRFPGTGMGLYIARQIVEAHRGTLTVRSKPGEGSAFTIDIPLAREEAGAITKWPDAA